MPFKTVNGRILVRNGHWCTTCCGSQGSGVVLIEYSWTPPQLDLDTGTSFLSTKVGWACSASGPYITWSGDNTGYGPEIVTVDVRAAYRDSAWASSCEIVCSAGWYSPAGGSGPALLTVTFNGVTQTLTISPGQQSNCASTTVARVTVHDDWTFTVF